MERSLFLLQRPGSVPSSLLGRLGRLYGLYAGKMREGSDHRPNLRKGAMDTTPLNFSRLDKGRVRKVAC